MRAARRNLSPQLQATHAAAIKRHLLGSELFRVKKRIAVYLSNDGEVDLSATITAFRELGHEVAAPRVAAGAMRFYALEPHDTLETNEWGIFEPLPAKPVSPQELDVALVPLVAFTDQGDRLGRGGGYYDRYFEAHEALLIGIGHELQRVPTLRRNAWDKPMDAVVTEKGWRLCSDRAQTTVEPASVATPT